MSTEEMSAHAQKEERIDASTLSTHRFCNARSAFTCRRDHYGLPVRFLVMGHIEPH